MGQKNWELLGTTWKLHENYKKLSNKEHSWNRFKEYEKGTHGKYKHNLKKTCDRAYGIKLIKTWRINWEHN
jgi:hypothetical protein